MLKIDEIKSFIDNDAASAKKQQAEVGVRYYEAKHDILKYRIFFLNKDGELQEDLIKSNIRIPHPFFTEMVDQAVQYVLSGDDAFIKSDDPELQKELNAYFNDNEDFIAELYELLTGCLVKGFEYMYAYQGKDDRLAFQTADSMGVVKVKAKETDDKCEYVIWWYVDSIGKNNTKIKRIQVWDEKETHFFCQEGEGKIVKDKSEKINPRPHKLWEENGVEGTLYDGFGFIPFFCLENNRKQTSDLRPIKPLIDSYDLMNCGLANNIQDTNEATYAISGYDGDNLDELLFTLRAKKGIGVGEGGNVEVLTVDIPVEARKTKMEIDEKNIYRFGMGLNTAGLKDTNATTNLAIKSAYSLLDLKATKLIIKLKQFFRKLLNPVLDEINERNGTAYEQKDVYFNFAPEVPTNEQENAQIELTDAQRKQTEINTVLNIATHLDNETVVRLICEQLELEFDDIKDKLPDPNEADPYKAQTALNGAVVDDPAGGGVIE